MDVVAPGNLPHGLAVLLATKNLLPLVRGEFGLVANLHPTRLRPLQTARARRSLSIRRFLRGEDAMVGHSSKMVDAAQPRTAGTNNSPAVGSQGASPGGMVGAGEGAGGANCEPTRKQHSPKSAR
jgi:hypothetical protein